MAKPLELIRFNVSTHNFEVGKEAVEVLQRVRGPVGVVAVLLDTEGIDAYDQTAQYSTQIFSLAVLLSSMFVYNQMGGIDEAALDRLSLVTEMTKHIRVRAGGEAGSDLGDFTPTFLWLLRDFYLTLEEDGRAVTPRAYLETALCAVQGSGPAVEAKNGIRESIKQLFPNRDCFTLVRPAQDERVLSRLEVVPPEQLRPEFRVGMQQLTELIFARAQPKRMGKQAINGPMLAGLAEAYVKAINRGAVPTITTAWQGVAEAESRRAADEAEACYAQTYNESVAAEEQAMDAEHQRALAVARALFDSEAVGDEGIRAAHAQRFVAACEGRYSHFREKRLAMAAAAVDRMLYSASMKFSQMSRQSSTTLEALQAELDAFIQEFSNSEDAAGPTKWRRLAAFMKDTYSQTYQDFLRRREAQFKQAEAAIRLEVEEGQRSTQRARQDLEGSRQQLQTAQVRQREAEQRAEEAEASCAQLQAQLLEVKKEIACLHVERDSGAARVAALQQQLEEAHRVRSSMAASTQQAAQAEINSIRAQHEVEMLNIKSQLAGARKAGEEQEAGLKASAAQQELLKQQLANAEEENATLLARLRSAEDLHMQAMRARDQALEQARSLEVEAREANAQLAAVQQRRQGEEARAEALLGELVSEGREALEAARISSSPRRGARGGGARAAAQQGPENADPEAGGVAPDMPPERMTIKEIQQWLVEHGHESAVWELSSSSKARKPQWVQLLREKAQLV